MKWKTTMLMTPSHPQDAALPHLLLHLHFHSDDDVVTVHEKIFDDENLVVDKDSFCLGVVLMLSCGRDDNVAERNCESTQSKIHLFSVNVSTK